MGGTEQIKIPCRCCGGFPEIDIHFIEQNSIIYDCGCLAALMMFNADVPRNFKKNWIKRNEKNNPFMKAGNEDV